MFKKNPPVVRHYERGVSTRNTVSTVHIYKDDRLYWETTEYVVGIALFYELEHILCDGVVKIFDQGELIREVETDISQLVAIVNEREEFLVFGRRGDNVLQLEMDSYHQRRWSWRRVDDLPPVIDIQGSGDQLTLMTTSISSGKKEVRLHRGDLVPYSTFDVELDWTVRIGYESVLFIHDGEGHVNLHDGDAFEALHHVTPGTLIGKDDRVLMAEAGELFLVQRDHEYIIKKI